MDIITLDSYLEDIDKSDASLGVKEDLKRKAIELFGTDELTQVRNRSYLITFLGEMIAESRREPQTDLSVVFYDLDNFGIINKAYDSTVGDRKLCEFASILKERVKRSTDFIARARSTKYAKEAGGRAVDISKNGIAFPGRYGGEEFSSVHPKTSKEDAKRIAESVRKAAEKKAIKHRTEDGKIVYLGTVSGGVGSVKDIEQVDILYTKLGNELLNGFFKGRYSELLREFGTERGIHDDKVNEYLEDLKNFAVTYTGTRKINLLPGEAFSESEYRGLLRNYMASMAFISELDRRGLQIAKKHCGKNVIVTL